MNNTSTNKKSFFITRTAMLLALALAVQFSLLRLFPGNPVIVYIVGSLINMILIIAALSTGVWSGAFIGIMTPLVAFTTGHLPFPVLIPFIAVANIILVVSFVLVKNFLGNKNTSFIVAGVIAALLKFLVMYLSATFILPLFAAIPAPAIAKLSAAWSIPQLVTALIGLGLAISIKTGLRKTNILESQN